MRIRNKILLIFTVLLIAIQACVTINKLGVTNLNYLYNDESNYAGLMVVPHHISKQQMHNGKFAKFEVAKKIGDGEKKNHPTT